MIRAERSSDFGAVREVIEQSFGRIDEVMLVDSLRALPGFDPGLSLVAEVEGRVVGHILFSPITIVSESQSWPALALAPLCVAPLYQKQGIGSALALSGLGECRLRRHAIVVVVGDTGYYRRFGFQAASHFGIRAPFEVPDEAFMIIELEDHALQGVRGVVKYSKPFGLEGDGG